MSRLYLEIAIDTSGQPKDTIFVGLASIKTQEIGKLERRFKKEFPQFYKSSQKGTKRKPDELFKIIKFLSDNNLRTYAIRFKSNNWFLFNKEYGNTSYFPERIYAILYFCLLKQVTFTHRRYRVTICNENYLRIQKVIDFCNYLCKAKHRKIEFTTGFAKNVFLIRLADFIAAAYRKVDTNKLNKIKNYTIIGDNFHYSFAQKVFKKSKYSQRKKK